MRDQIWRHEVKEATVKHYTLTCGERMMLFSRVEESRGSPDTNDQEDTLLTSSPASDKAAMQ